MIYKSKQHIKMGDYSMEFQFSDRVNSFQPSIFTVLNEKKEELIKQGRKVYNLSVGTPDFKPAPHVMEAMKNACDNPDNYKYAIVDKPELLEAVCYRYKERYGVNLHKDEVMSVYGSQEGMAHIGWALCNQGDVVLVPDPGYPIFEAGSFLAGAVVEKYSLDKNNGFLPNLNAISDEVLAKAKFMIVSYPLNPVCVTAPDEFYVELIAFAKKYNIIILHDNAYSDIVYTKELGKSFLSFEGAKDVGVEFYSLSKSYNLTGARISFVVGNKEIIDKFKIIRSQIDYGIFIPIQYAAIAALTGPDNFILEQRDEYYKRNKALCGGLRSIGWDIPDSQGTMFAWGPIPNGYTDSVKFCMELIEKAGVIVTPGSCFGSLGEGYVRFALVENVDNINKLIRAIDECGILK